MQICAQVSGDICQAVHDIISIIKARRMWEIYHNIIPPGARAPSPTGVLLIMRFGWVSDFDEG
jgi:hypothetical protein